ncbi:MAG: ABC transporter ATP-binding protein [Nocardioidaceae bacterium]
MSLEHLRIGLPDPAGTLPVLHDVTLSVDAGEIVGLAGESGSGKSLTAQALLGLLPRGAETTGHARFDGRDLLTQSGRQWRTIRGAEIAMVFQDATTALHPMLTIGAQLTEHMRHHLGLDRRAARSRAVGLLDQVRVPDPEHALRAYPHQFSGGMRQRAAIAIALACRPKLLIADEPTTALDVTVQAGILTLLEQLRDEYGLAVLFISHDLGVLSALAHRAYVLYAGRMMESGPTRSLLHTPHHPYTRALLDARPHGVVRADELNPIPGSPVVPGHQPAGCPFEPRCPYAEEACAVAPPALLEVEPGRSSACPVAPDLSGVPADPEVSR